MSGWLGGWVSESVSLCLFFVVVVVVAFLIEKVNKYKHTSEFL